MERHLNATDTDWVESVFTDNERAQADPQPNTSLFYAGRYAAKEAVAKALGTGFADEVAWRDIEILRRPTGAVAANLRDGALNVANSLGISEWLISISHSGGFAVASAIAVGE